MTQQRRTALKELQKLDLSIQEARTRIAGFDPRFEEVEEPALMLESELETSRKRLKEMKLEARRLESASEDRRERIKKLEERLGNVRNLREESAVSTELDMVRRALENDESEALTLIDQVRKGEERVTELEEAFAEATELVEPKKQALLEERASVKENLASLEKERESFTAAMDDEELRIYEAIRGNGTRRAIAELTEDGACANCFGMVPLQQQSEIRHGEKLIRCEACGVILAAPEPVEEGADEEAAPGEPDDSAAAEDASDADGVESADGDDSDGDDEEE